MYDNYLFDLYGTLIDLHTNETKPTLWRALARIYSMNGAIYTGPEMYKLYKIMRRKQLEERLPIMRKKYRAPDLALSEVEADLDLIFDEMFRLKGVIPTSELIEQVAIAFRSISIKYIKLFEGVPELIDGLHANGKKVYLLSNAQASFTRPEMMSLGIYDKFDGIFFSSDVGIMKPSPYFYKLLLDTFNLDKDKSVMVGNEYKADVMGSHKAGLDSIFVHTAATWDNVGELPSGCREIDDIRKVYDVKSN